MQRLCQIAVKSAEPKHTPYLPAVNTQINITLRQGVPTGVRAKQIGSANAIFFKYRRNDPANFAYRINPIHFLTPFL